MSKTDIYPARLLREAKDSLPTGRGRPRGHLLRRAVPTGYYALFHRIARDVAIEALGTAESSAAHALVRWITHGDLRELTDAVAGGRRHTTFAPVLTPSPRLLALCGLFAGLQDARHQADYDHSYRLTLYEARGLVRQAETAVSDATARRSNDASYQLFLRLALGSVRIAKSR